MNTLREYDRGSEIGYCDVTTGSCRISNAKPVQAGHRLAERGQALIALLIVIAIMMIVGFSIYSKEIPAENHAMDEAKGIACGAYTSQIRMAIGMYKSDHGTYPPDLDSLKHSYGIVDEMIHNKDCPYGYDPSTGTLTPPAPVGAPGAPASASSTNAPPASGSGGGTVIGATESTPQIRIPNYGNGSLGGSGGGAGGAAAPGDDGR